MASPKNKERFEIKCALCGVKDSVPFKPRGGEMCRKCHTGSRGSVPRKDHNTRVSFPIECASCGKNEVLEYVPKGARKNYFCSTCAPKHLGEGSRWQEVQKQRVKEEQSQWRVNCMECSVVMLLSQKPWPGLEYMCDNCKNDVVPAGDDALRGTQEVGTAVHIRRAKK